MNHNVKHIFTGALIAGLLTGAAAFASENGNQSTDDNGKMSGGKDGCQGKSAKDKDSCKGHTKKKSKNSCAGKDGCGQKEKKSGE